MPEPYIASSLPAHKVAELHRLMTEEIREVAVFLMDPNGIITVWNRGAEEMKGYTAADAIGQHLRLLYTEEDKIRHWPEHNLRKAAEDGFYREEQWRQRKDGTLFWANISLTALYDDAGTHVGFSKITLDLTPHLDLEKCLKEKEEANRILQAAQAGIWKWDVAADKVEASPHFLALLGYPVTEQCFDFTTWMNFVYPADRPEVTRLLLGAHDDSPSLPLTMQMRMCRKDGSPHWFYMRADWYRERESDPQILMGVHVDIQHLKTLEEEREGLFRQLQAEKEQAQVTLSAISDSVITTGLDGAIVSLNPAAERLTGWQEADAIGRTISQLCTIMDEETDTPANDLIEQCMKEGRVIRGTPNTVVIDQNGARHSVELSAAPIRRVDSDMIGAVLAFHDVSESRQLLRDLNYQATHDALTGLVNRTEFEARLQRMLDRSEVPDGQYSVLLYMDLDQFKIVNDTCGHPDGDELLRQLAQVYREHLRENDTLARIGGDEFAMIVEACTFEQAIDVAETFLETTRRFRFPCKGHLFKIGISIGMVAIDAHSATVEKLLRTADHACYLAKEAGRNQIYVQQQGDVDIAQRRSDMQWVRRLDQAIQNNHLKLFFQPIVSLGAEQGGLHYETLLRLDDPGSKPIKPDTFLPAAERYDVMPAVDRWVLRSSLQWLE